MLRTDITKLESFYGASYILLPDEKKRRNCINPKNFNDNKCFLYSFIIGKHIKDIKKHPEDISILKKYEKNINQSTLNYPVTID